MNYFAILIIKDKYKRQEKDPGWIGCALFAPRMFFCLLNFYLFLIT
jgi:hypothetical protein